MINAYFWKISNLAKLFIENLNAWLRSHTLYHLYDASHHSSIKDSWMTCLHCWLSLTIEYCAVYSVKWWAIHDNWFHSLRHSEDNKKHRSNYSIYSSICIRQRMWFLFGKEQFQKSINKSISFDYLTCHLIDCGLISLNMLLSERKRLNHKWYYNGLRFQEIFISRSFSSSAVIFASAVRYLID